MNKAIKILLIIMLIIITFSLISTIHGLIIICGMVVLFLGLKKLKNAISSKTITTVDTEGNPHKVKVLHIIIIFLLFIIICSLISIILQFLGSLISEHDWTLILAVLFIICGMVVLFLGIKKLKNAISSKTWPTTVGKVVSSGVRESFGDGKTHEVTVLYNYSVEGNVYSSRNISAMEMGFATSRKAHNVADRYSPESEVIVHYNPQNPKMAVLETGARLSDYWVIVVGLIFFGVGLYMFSMAYSVDDASEVMTPEPIATPRIPIDIFDGYYECNNTIPHDVSLYSWLEEYEWIDGADDWNRFQESAYVEWALENAGYNTLIIADVTRVDDTFYPMHAAVMIQVDNHEWILFYTTERVIVYDPTLVSDEAFENINDCYNYFKSEDYTMVEFEKDWGWWCKLRGE